MSSTVSELLGYLQFLAFMRGMSKYFKRGWHTELKTRCMVEKIKYNLLLKIIVKRKQQGSVKQEL